MTTYSNIVTQPESEYEIATSSQDGSEIREPHHRGSYSTRDESADVHEVFYESQDILGSKIRDARQISTY